MTEKEVLEDMEKELLVDRYGLDYEGVFDFEGLLKRIDDWCRDNDFHLEILSRKDKVTSEGRKISIGYNIYRKWKKMYFTVIGFDLSIEDMKDIEVEVDGRMRNLNKGKVDAIFHSFLMTSIKARWETKGYLYFLRGIVDKFIYKVDKPAYRGIVVEDTYNLINEVKGSLNIYAHIGGGKPPTGRLKGGWV
ncbi:MAG TPA: hypothetical protein VJC00_02275 [Candidatus Nanoarchaeia archaeon]|nr:hypothetical protein [Candidatus Nanoarchaeia archaeon]